MNQHAHAVGGFFLTKLFVPPDQVCGHRFPTAPFANE